MPQASPDKCLCDIEKRLACEGLSTMMFKLLLYKKRVVSSFESSISLKKLKVSLKVRTWNLIHRLRHMCRGVFCTFGPATTETTPNAVIGSVL